MVYEECDCCDDELDEETHAIQMTHNEIMFLDDSLTMMIERDPIHESVTTMRAMMPSAYLPAPVTLLDKVGLAVLDITDPDSNQQETIIYLNDSEIYMLREICHSYCKIGREQVGYNLKRKLYLALYNDSSAKNKVVDNLLATVDLDIKEPTPKSDK